MRNDFNELHAAEIFLQVVRAGSFANAARARGNNPSSLTRAVAELERRLGAPLLTRTTRRLHLTEAGELYRQHAEAMLAAQREAHEGLASLTGGVPRGLLRVSLPVVVGEEVLAPRLPEFHARYPELRLELDLSDRFAPLVQAGFDVAIRFGVQPDSSLRVQRLGTVRRGLYAHPDWVARHGAPAHPAALPALPCITLGQLAGPVEWRFWQGEDVQRLVIGGWLHTTSSRVARQMAENGLGITRLVSWLAEPAVQAGRLVPLLPDWRCDSPREGGLPLNAVFTPGSPGQRVPLKARLFAEFMQELVQELGLTG